MVFSAKNILKIFINLHEELELEELLEEPVFPEFSDDDFTL